MSSTESTVEKYLPEIARNLKENYLELLTEILGMARKIEELIIEISSQEEGLFDKHLVGKAKALEGSLDTFERHIEEILKVSFRLKDESILQVNYFVFALQLYNRILKEKQITAKDENVAKRLRLLHPENISRRQKLNHRRRSRDHFIEERRKRVEAKIGSSGESSASS